MSEEYCLNCGLEQPIGKKWVEDDEGNTFCQLSCKLEHIEEVRKNLAEVNQ